MKILFMGTTDYAVACLDAMRSAGYEAAAVCTKVDRPKNRGMKMAFSPVKVTNILSAVICCSKCEENCSTDIRERLS